MTKLIIFFFFIQINSLIFAQKNTSDYEIATIQKKFKSISNLTADFSQKNISSYNNGIELSGKFYFTKNGAYRIEVKDKTLLSDGNSIYNIDNKLSRVVISSIDDSAMSFSLEKIIMEYPGKCRTIVVEENNGKILEMTAKANDLLFKKVYLFVDKDYIPRKIKIVDLAENQTVIELKSVIINSQVPESKFIFKEIKGFEIVDLR